MLRMTIELIWVVQGYMSTSSIVYVVAYINIYVYIAISNKQFFASETVKQV